MNRRREKGDEKGESRAGCQRCGCFCKLLKVSSAHLHVCLGDFYDVLLFCLGQVISKSPFFKWLKSGKHHVLDFHLFVGRAGPRMGHFTDLPEAFPSRSF